MRNQKSEIHPPVGYGLIGAGAFGRYCLGAYASLGEVKRVAVADVDASLARRAADEHGLAACTVDELLARADVELVHLATPPWTHKELALRAIDAGKHVLCEKPLAVTLDDGRAMIDAAKAKGVNLAANLIMRHVPHCERVGAVLASGLLGEPIHAWFVNDAKDQELGPGHWFWDPAKSGGIFIEHGVHFFDVFDGWLNPLQNQAKPLAAHAARRPGNPAIVERVQATVRYGDADSGVDATFFHGFTQANAMDRQSWRIVCERGEIRMSEWVPQTLVVDALLRDAEVATVAGAMGGVEIERVAVFRGDERRLASRHKAYEADGRYVLRSGDPREKAELYGVALRALLADQARGIRDPSHARRVDETHALRSLELAALATQTARC